MLRVCLTLRTRVLLLKPHQKDENGRCDPSKNMVYLKQGFCSRAALKGTNLRGQPPICGFCGFLWLCAASCENRRFPNALLSGNPKGPSRTKNSTESKFATARQIRYGNSKTLRRVLRSACFSRKERQENGTDSENYGSSKILRNRVPYYF